MSKNIHVYVLVHMLSGAYGTGPLTVGMASFGQFISVPVCVFKTKQQ